MATKSFTRNIEVTKLDAIRKIHSAMKANGVHKLKTPIKNIDVVKNQSRKKIAFTLTHRY